MREPHYNGESENNIFRNDKDVKLKELEQQLASEQQRTLRYKELLYSQTEQGVYIKELEQKLAEAVRVIDNLEAAAKVAEDHMWGSDISRQEEKHRSSELELKINHLERSLEERDRVLILYIQELVETKEKLAKAVNDNITLSGKEGVNG
jgi:hypothetical protein